MVKVTIRLWGRLAEQAGKREFHIVVRTLRELKEILIKRFNNDNFALAVNEKIVNDNIILREGDVVDVIPPVSGG